MQGSSGNAASGSASNSSSLLGKAVFTSKFEKDLLTAKGVREALAKELPKSPVRMISANWLHLYFKWIDYIQSPTKVSELQICSPTYNKA